MVKTILKKIFGSRFDRELKKIQPVVDRIHEHEKRLGTLSEDELKGQTERFRALLKERYGALQEQVDATKAEKHGCADPIERDKLTGEIHDLEEELKREIEAALDDILPAA